MSVKKSKLPRRLAAAGVIVGLGLLAASWYMAKYNVFHLPTLQESQHMGSYSAPALLSFLQTLAIVLCPSLVLEIPLSDASGYAWPLAVWLIAAAINGVLYYWVGRAIVALARPFRRAERQGGSRTAPTE